MEDDEEEKEDHDENDGKYDEVESNLLPLQLLQSCLHIAGGASESAVSSCLSHKNHSLASHAGRISHPPPTASPTHSTDGGTCLCSGRAIASKLQRCTPLQPDVLSCYLFFSIVTIPDC